MENKGWECPKCGTVHSPGVHTCKVCQPRDNSENGSKLVINPAKEAPR